MKKTLALFLSLLIAFAPLAHAQSTTGGGDDPLLVTDLGPTKGSQYNGFNDLTLKTEVAPPTTGKRVLIISTGQSNGGNPGDGVLSFTASITTTVMTVTAMGTSSSLAVGQTIYGSDTGAGITATTIASLGTGTGGTGTYNIVTSQTVASTNKFRARYTPTNPNAIYNLNFQTGGFYRLTDPVLGAGGPGGSFWTMVADQLVTAGKAASVTVASINVGATLAADWSSTGAMYSRIGNVARRVLSKTNYTPSICIIARHQGESDNGAGTLQAAYTASLASEILQWRALLPTCAIFVAKVSFFNSTTSANVTNAQVAAVNNTTVYSLGDFDTITNCALRNAGTCIDYNYQGNAAAAAVAVTPLGVYIDAH